MEDTERRPDKSDTIVRSPHLWVIAALIVILGLSYYADQFGSSLILFGEKFFTSEYLHDLHRSLFLIPMLYAAAAFHLRGALVVSFVALCVVLPRAIFISPNPDPIFRAVIFIVLAGLAAALLGLEQDRRQRERAAVRELDSAHQELQSSTELLRASEARYRDLFDSASEAIFIHDLEGNIVEANQAAAMLTGYRVEELARMNMSQLLSAESLESDMERQQGLLEGTAATQRYELELITRDGAKRTIESVARLISADGQPASVQEIVRDVTEQKQIRENLQFYISQITRAQEEERKRISRDLHDETAQGLASLLLDIEAICRGRDQLSDETMRYLEQLRAKARSIMDEVRRFSHQLRPGILDQIGLVPALEMLADELKEGGGIDACVQVIGAKRRLSPEAELVLFRIAQEALNNVRKHSQATEAAVRVEFGSEKVRLEVSDNGKGFEAPRVLSDLASGGKLGLIGMHERARLLDASFSVESHLDKGTAVQIEVAG